MHKLIAIATVILFFSAPVSAEVIKSTLDDQSSVELTVYNSQLGLVKDTREIQLIEGEGELRFMDVASAINPVTVHIKSINYPDQLAILEQNYEYDLISESKLLEKYVGRDLEILVYNEYQNKKETLKAELISNNQGPVYRIEDKIYLGHPGIKVLPEIPENLIEKPTLTWYYQNESRESHEVEVSYLTDRIGWKADYILTLGQDDDRTDLSGWVTIQNQSGTTYEDAQLKLVAGDVNRVRQMHPKAVMMQAMDMGRAESRAQFGSEQFFEYHLYDLKRRTTLKNNQTKQIRFIEAFGISVEKEYVIESSVNYYGIYRQHDPKVPVRVFVKFENKKGDGLGEPLPAGTMRLYKEDQKGSLQFIGEDLIEHTPKDEEVRLKLGNAFDVKAERKQLNYKRINNKTHESEWEIRIRNHKEEGVVVDVIETLSGQWKITKKSHRFKKESATKARFHVKVPKDKEAKLTYTARITT